MTTPAQTKIVPVSPPATTNRPPSVTATPPSSPAPSPAAVAAATTKPTDEQVKAAKAAAAAEAKAELEFITGGVVMLTAELADKAAPVRARSEKQAAMDGVVKKLHSAWKASDRPTTWEKLVAANCVATYFVDPEKTADIHKLINRAATFHGVRVRMGTSFKATELMARKYNLPANYVGREVVSFAVLDKQERAKSNGKPASEIVAEKK